MIERSNLLLDLMPEEVRIEVTETATPFDVPCGHRVPDEGRVGTHLFILIDGVASEIVVGQDGRLTEVGMIGHEGMFPMAALMFVPSAPNLFVAQVGSLRGWRVRTKDFHRILSTSPESQLLVRKASYGFLTQLASNILTVEQNSVAARIARWLLMCHDRISGDDIHVTHDTLAQMAGAHRPTVTNTLHILRADGLIDLSRGCVTIHRRDKLRILADGSYGQSEDYWQQHIGAFGKDPVSSPGQSLSSSASQ